MFPVFAAGSKSATIRRAIVEPMDNEALLHFADVRCSKCGAEIGEPCCLPSGGIRYAPHKDRQDEAEARLEDAKQEARTAAMAWLMSVPRYS